MSAPYLLGSSGNTLRESFGKALVDLMPEFPNVVVVDGDVAGGTGAHHVRKAFPERFFQIGIAEQNIMCVAAGLEQVGLIPVVSGFAVFNLRGFEMIRLSIACDNRNVKIIGSHPGLDAGPDGASAQCMEDLGVMMTLANMTVVSPADQVEVAQATRAILEHYGPVYMRTGRSPAPQLFDASHAFVLGKGQILIEGSDITLIACGVQVSRCLQAAELLSAQGVSAQVVNMPTLKPIDSELIVSCAQKTGAILTSEDHNTLSGLGCQVARVVVQRYPVKMAFNGVHDMFGESGEPDELADKFRLSAPHIAADAIALLEQKHG